MNIAKSIYCTLLVALSIQGLLMPMAHAQEDVEVALGLNGPGVYAAGVTVTIEVQLALFYPGEENPVTSLGIYQTLPVGWTLIDVVDMGMGTPSVVNQPDVTNTIEMAFINSPDKPAFTFAYVIQVPPQDGGDRMITGQVEYRLDAGPRQSGIAAHAMEGPLGGEPPKIVLLGRNPLDWPQGTAWRDPGYSASAMDGSDLSARVQVSGQVDTSLVGQYFLQYTVRDNNGREAVPISRSVRVRSGVVDSDEDTDQEDASGEGDGSPGEPGNTVNLSGPDNTAVRSSDIPMHNKKQGALGIGSANTKATAKKQRRPRRLALRERIASPNSSSPLVIERAPKESSTPDSVAVTPDTALTPPPLNEMDARDSNALAAAQPQDNAFIRSNEVPSASLSENKVSTWIPLGIALAVMAVLGLVLRFVLGRLYGRGSR